MFEMKVRFVLGVLVFGMFFLNQMNRVNISLAIVAITHARSTANYTSTEWDNKPMLLGAFFWFSWITQLSGAYLFGKFGCRKVLTVAYLTNGICSLLFPMTYKLNSFCAIIIRMIQGFALGVSWPALGWISARWIPKLERNKFLSAYQGTSLGGSVTNLLGGVIIDSYGWSYLFYLSGTLCILWVFLLRYNVYDRPAEHPRISDEERSYLDKYVEAVTVEKKAAPWFAIFRSMPFWAVCLMFFSLMLFHVTLALQLPSYFDTVHAVQIRTNGYLLSMPDIGKVLIGLTFPLLIDYLVKIGTITLATARKLSITIGMSVPAILIVLFGLYGYTSVKLAIVLVALAIGMSGISSSSIIASVVDLSPNYSGNLMGFLKTIADIPGILSPIMVKYVLDGDTANWQTVFFILSTLTICSCIFFLLFGSVEVQPWNNQKEKSTIENKEDAPIIMETGTEKCGQRDECFTNISNEDVLIDRTTSSDKNRQPTDS